MIAASDIQFLLSAPQAASGYTMPGSPGNSLGLFVSTSQLSQAQSGYDNLFADLTGAQNAANQVDYACVFVYNSNTSNVMLNPLVWLPSSLLGASNEAVFAVGADLQVPTPLASTAGQAAAIQTPTQAPSGIVSWASPSASASGGVALPNIPARYVAAVWVRRTANGVAATNSFNIEVTFDSLP